MGPASSHQEGSLMPRRSSRRLPPELPGWAPLTGPSRRPRVGRGWLLPLVAGCLIALPFVALFAYLFATDPSSGLSPRSWFTFGLAAAVGLVLVVRGYRQGQLPVWRTLTEYVAVAALAALVVTVPGPPPAATDRPAIAVEQPGRGSDRSRVRREARPAPAEHQEQDQTASLPPVLRQVVGAAQWLAGLWQEADRRTPGQPTTTTTTTDRERPAGAAPPLSSPGGMPA
jgi:hypothetical protein